MPIKKLRIKTYKAKKGTTIVNLLIALAKEMVIFKKKLNEIIEEVNKNAK